MLLVGSGPALLDAIPSTGGPALGGSGAEDQAEGGSRTSFFRTGLPQEFPHWVSYVFKSWPSGWTSRGALGSLGPRGSDCCRGGQGSGPAPAPRPRPPALPPWAPGTFHSFRAPAGGWEPRGAGVLAATTGEAGERGRVGEGQLGPGAEGPGGPRPHPLRPGRRHSVDFGPPHGARRRGGGMGRGGGSLGASLPGEGRGRGGGSDQTVGA